MKKAIPLLLKRMASSLAACRQVRFAYIYGSVLTRRDARDIDVAVYLSGRADPWDETQEIAGRLDKALASHLPVDVHAVNGASAAFAFEVVSKGRVLFERNREERLNWEAHAMSRYQDIKPMLDFHDRSFLSR